jgi:O-antigen/teichoic acid export membrane protein
VSALAVAELAGKVASFVMFAVAARVLGVADFGVFSWSFNLALMMATFVLWGFDIALIQLASRTPSRLNELLANTLALRALLIPPAVLIAVLIPGSPSGARTVTALLTLAVLLDSANQAIRSAAAVRDRQSAVAVNLVVQRIVTAALAVGVLLAGGGVLGMSIAYLAGTFVGVGLMFWTGHRIDLRPRLRHVSVEGIREIAGGSTALGLSTTINMLLFRIDTVLLGWLLNTTAVGAYSAAFKLFETALFVLWSVDRVALPTMTAATGPEPVRRGVHRACAVVFAVYVPYALVLGLRADEVLTLVFGRDYGVDSAGALQWLMVALIPYTVQYVVASGLLARSRNRQVTVAGFVALVVNIGANLWLIPRYGPAGAAAATVIAMLVQAGIVWVLLTRFVGGPGVWRAAVVPGLSGAVIVPVLLSPLGLIPATFAAAVVYVAVWFVLAGKFDPNARSTLLGMAGIKR